MTIKKKREDQPIVIDLTGPEGNAFVLLGKAKGFAKQIGLDSEAIQEKMMEGDYEHLVKTFDKYFGTFCTLLR